MIEDTTALYRQIHPSFIHDGRATSQAFKPMPKDEGKLSVYCGSIISAQDSWLHYTEQQKLASGGVLSVLAGECRSYGVPPTLDADPYPSHASIDFTAHNANQIEKISKHLRNIAMAKGWQFRPSG